MKNIIVTEIAQSNGQQAIADLHQNSITQFIEVSGTRYAYRELGNADGIPLVLLQHFTGIMDNWDPLITNGLAIYFRVLLFDNKGIGASSGQTPDNIEAMAQDAISVIKALGFNRVNLLGFSMGGFIAQQITLDQPGLVNKLILAGTGPKGGEGLANSEKALTVTAAMTPQEQKLYFFYNSTPNSRALGKESLSRISKRTVNRDTEIVFPAIIAQLKSIVAWAQPDADTLKRLRQIKQPVFIVNGNNDIICPTINSYTMFQNLPDAKLSLYPDSGHGSIFQYPGLFLSEAVPFLKAE